MRITIVTVCFNASEEIEDCLCSVAGQTYGDIEHVIVDGKSTDGTMDIISRFPHVQKVISEPDQGIYDAMNKGVLAATGDYILFLNADDRLQSSRSIALAVAFIQAAQGGDVYYGDLEVRGATGSKHVFRPPGVADALEFMLDGCLPHQSTLARPAVFGRTSGFDTRYRIAADYDWFLKVLADPEIDVRSMPVLLGSFKLGGASSHFAATQPEVNYIQDISPAYASPDWQKKRREARERVRRRQRQEARASVRFGRLLGSYLRRYLPLSWTNNLRTARAFFRRAF
jgi:glycosyltransferase involved in cell wall biosynthesis